MKAGNFFRAAVVGVVACTSAGAAKAEQQSVADASIVMHYAEGGSKLAVTGYKSFKDCENAAQFYANLPNTYARWKPLDCKDEAKNLTRPVECSRDGNAFFCGLGGQ